MAKKHVSQKLTLTSSKIANIGDLLLGEEGHDWEVDEIHLVPKNGSPNDKIICKNVLENGKWVLKCTKP